MAKGVKVDELDDIVQEFLVESHENLDQLDRDLVALEQEPDSRDLLSSIFRTIHTIKGTSGFLAFNRLETLTHVGESLLARLRDGAQPMTPQTTDALLRMVDGVRALLAAIEAATAPRATSTTRRRDRRGHRLHRRSDGPAAAAPGRPMPRRRRRRRAAGRRGRRAPPRRRRDGRAGRDGRRSPRPPSRGRRSPAAAAETPVARRLLERGVAVGPESTGPTAESRHGVADATADEGRCRRVDDAGQPRRSVADSADPRRRRPARHPDAPGRRAGADPQPDRPRRRASAGDAGAGPHRAAAQPDHQRAAGGRHEDAHAADRPPLVEAAPRRPRPGQRAAASRSSWSMEGKETELDRSLLEAVKDPLTHLVRNAVDHGIEPPDDAGRRRQGPPRAR